MSRLGTDCGVAGDDRQCALPGLVVQRPGVRRAVPLQHQLGAVLLADGAPACLLQGARTAAA